MAYIFPKILIVEDDLDIQENLKDFLMMENYSVVTASNGKIGLDLIQQEKPDLILLDLMMPVMSGYEMLKELKKRDFFIKNPIPIVLLSAATDIEQVASEQQVKFIRKPISLDKLLANIKDSHLPLN